MFGLSRQDPELGPKSWEIYFDGAASMKSDASHTPRAGVGLIFVTPMGEF